MNTSLGTCNIINKRETIRIKPKQSVAITSHGIGMVTSISADGLSFKCSKNLGFPSEISVDIYDPKGSCLIEKMVLEKVWEKRIPGCRFSSPFSVEIGCCFAQLSALQKTQIGNYLKTLAETEQQEDALH